MSDAPTLPAHISSDGREVWAWADALSKHTHRIHKMRELRQEIFSTGRECGDCDKWMKSRECPRERNVDGMSRGPSCGASICSAFVEAKSATARREELQAELAVLEAEQ